MRYVSLFSGIEAASVAWDGLDMKPIAFSEIDPFPSAVLADRYPDVPNLGDITKIDWGDWLGGNPRPDVVVGGSPCQSFSVAGTRTGLEGASGLMLEYVRAVRELRPRWLLWENVPGALSSTGGEDFRCLLSSLDELGYGLAWRVLDAQFFGVAQRRRRVFLVGCIADGGAGLSCEVLFESDCLRGNPPTSAEKRKALAAAAGKRVAEPDGALNGWDVQSRRVFDPGAVGPTLSSGASEGMNIQPSVLTASPTLTAQHGRGAQPPNIVSYGFKYHVSARAGTTGFEEEVAPTQIAGKPPAVCMANRTGKAAVDVELSGTLMANNEKNQPIVTMGFAVRRLTPIECERLQGFPSVIRLEVGDMTADELIACALANDDIFCDFTSGKVYGRRGPGGMRLATPTELGFKHPSGYIHVSLHANGEKKQVRAHRIIYIAAYGGIPDGCVIDHINGVKDDNRLCNLQMMTTEGNSRKARLDGAYLTGDDNPSSKVSAEVRTQIVRDYKAGLGTYRELAKKYGISKTRVHQLVHEDGWTRVPYRGRPAEECPDGPRYKAIGNSMAVPVMRWIGRRMLAADTLYGGGA